MKPDQPSNTALIVAAGMQLLNPPNELAHVMPRDAISRGAALLQLAHPRLARLIQRSWFADACRAMEQATLPGIFMHYALRKQGLRNYAHAAIGEGCLQVVVLGAGLDTLGAELKAVYPQLCCIEIDHPASQAVKRSVAAHDVHYIGADLAQHSLTAILAACTVFRPAVPTLFVAEGLLMYLPLADVAHLFVQMSASAPDSRVAFTWFEPQADGKPNFARRSRLVDWWLRLRAEPFLSGLPRGRLGAFLAAAGYSLQAVSDSADLLPPSLRGQLAQACMPIDGEYIAITGRGHAKLPER